MLLQDTGKEFSGVYISLLDTVEWCVYLTARYSRAVCMSQCKIQKRGGLSECLAMRSSKGVECVSGLP